MKRWLVGLLLIVPLLSHATDNCAALPAPAVLSANGAEPTPAMGITTWYPQWTSPTETYIKNQSDLLVSTGLSALGYKTVEISDGWQGATRTGGGAIQANGTNFTGSALTTVVSYIHSKGLAATFYTSPYTTTCSGEIGSGLNESADLATFVSWGMTNGDRLEYDGCSVNLLYASCYPQSTPQIYQYMANFVRGTGLTIQMMLGFDPSVASANGGPSPLPWGKDVGWNEGRISLAYNNGAAGGGDLNGVWSNFDQYFDKAAVMAVYIGPGFFPHGDYLIGQNINAHFAGTFTATESKTQFSMLSLWAAPLILGMDISTLTGTNCASATSADTLYTYCNAEVIAVDQDIAGKMGTRRSQVVCGSSTCEVWVKPLHDGTFAVGLLNRDSSSQTISVDLTTIHAGGGAVRDLWAKSNLGNMTSYSTSVAAHGISMLKLTPAMNGSMMSNLVLQNATIQ